MANGPAQSTRCDPQMPREADCAAVTPYMRNYLWKIEDFSPAIDAALWKMMRCRTMEYFQSVNIRDNAISAGKELRRNFRMGKRERAKYAALDYMRRNGPIADTAGRPNGILVEWEEVRIADSCAQTLLINTNPEQRHAKTARRKNRMPAHLPRPWKRRKSRTSQRDEIRRATHQRRNVSMRKKSMPIHRSNTPQKTRKMQTQGQEQKKLIEAIEGPNGQKSRTIPWQDRRYTGESRKNAGLTKTQFKS